MAHSHPVTLAHSPPHCTLTTLPPKHCSFIDISYSLIPHYYSSPPVHKQTRDVYGFIIDGHRAVGYRAFYEKYSRISQLQVIKATSLIEAGVFKNWTCPYARGSKPGVENSRFAEVETLVLTGLPHRNRGKIWLQITGVASKMGLKEGVYSSLLDPYRPENAEYNGICSSPSTVQIEKDIPRTFPNYTTTPLSKPFQPALRNLLRAYAMRNPRLGYCQSMNFIAGGLLLFLDEEEAFWLLCFIVEELLPDYFCKNIIGPKIDAKVLTELLADQLPQLYDHFASLSLDVVLICTQWFMCLFTRTLPIECAFRIWDALFLYGPQVLFEVGLAVFKMHQNELLMLEDTIDIITCLGNSLNELFDCSTIWEVPIMRLTHKRVAASREIQKEKVQRDMRMQTDISDLMDVLPVSKFSRETLEELYVQYANLRAIVDVDIVEAGMPKLIFQKVILNMFPWRYDQYFFDRLFRMFDVNKNGNVDFKELISGLSVLCKGTNDEKLRMAFAMFDKNSDGFIGKEEFSTMLTSLYRVVPLDQPKVLSATIHAEDSVPSSPEPAQHKNSPPSQEPEKATELASVHACEVAIYVNLIFKDLDQLPPDEFRERVLLQPLIVKAFNLDHLSQSSELRISIS